MILLMRDRQEGQVCGNDSEEAGKTNLEVPLNMIDLLFGWTERNCQMFTHLREPSQKTPQDLLLQGRFLSC